MSVLSRQFILHDIGTLNKFRRYIMDSRFVKVNKVIINENISELRNDIYELLAKAIRRFWSVYLARVLTTLATAVYTGVILMRNTEDVPSRDGIILTTLLVATLVTFVLIDTDQRYKIVFNGHHKVIYLVSLFEHRKELREIESCMGNIWLIKFLRIDGVCDLVPTRDLWLVILEHDTNFITYDIEKERLLVRSGNEPSISIDMSDVSVASIEGDEVAVVLYFNKVEVVDETLKSDIPASVVYAKEYCGTEHSDN